MTDPKEIIELLAAGKKDKAKVKLIEFLSSVELTDEEKGKLYAQMAEIALDTQRAVMEEYKEFSKEALESLKPRV